MQQQQQQQYQCTDDNHQSSITVLSKSIYRSTSYAHNGADNEKKYRPDRLTPYAARMLRF